MQDMTNLDNPNSVQQMKMWLSDNGMEMESLGKKEVAAAIKTAPQDITDVLSLRQQLAKSSVKKYTAMETPSAEITVQEDVSVLRSQPNRKICRKADSITELTSKPHGRSSRGSWSCA